MNKRNLIIGAIISVLIIITTVVALIIVGPKIKKKQNNEFAVEQPSQVAKEETEILVATIEKKQEQEEPVYKDATTITQDLQDMGQNIAKLVIPKIELDTEVYCKQDANQMEEVPCMLYTNQGPNQPGVTILVGHNRNNGLLFSNNNQLEENDELYLTDYINNQEKKYTVYSKFVTSGTDVSFYNMPSDKPIIAMQCCLTPTDTENVLIIMAKAE